ncbi:MAG TPA: hypothetical protein VFV75_10445 [Candidatus Polarisedimenticolaceae bacterium]|nr:hypothetical protein [Candidatus Polarisedimenticolaceae bacterium]
MRLPTPGLLLLPALLVPLGCTSDPADAAAAVRPPAAAALAPAAEGYVALVLALGRHDARVVDAYYGPREWKERAERGAPVPLPALLDRARALLSQVRAAGASDRRTFLLAQLVALETDLRRRLGERFTLAEEARLLFDAEPSYVTVDALEEARRSLEGVVPGAGDLGRRVEALKRRFTVPPDRVEEVARAVLEESRRRTVAAVDLPAGEGVALRQVTGASWGAYNWYLGGLKSRIELNVGLPVQLAGLAHTLVHEGYPGHHVFNVLQEDRLVRMRGFVERTVYPLWSPESLIAEGTADAAWDTIFPGEEGRAFVRDTLAPLAGFTDKEALDTYLAVSEAMEHLEGTRPLAARMLLEEGRPEEEVRAFLMRYALQDQEHAERALAFIREYRAYVFTYVIGKDLVERAVGTGPDRAARFFAILQKAATPGELAGRTAPPG